MSLNFTWIFSEFYYKAFIQLVLNELVFFSTVPASSHFVTILRVDSELCTTCFACCDTADRGFEASAADNGIERIIFLIN